MGHHANTVKSRQWTNNSPYKPKYTSDEEPFLSDSLFNYYRSNLEDLLKGSFEMKNVSITGSGVKLPPVELLFKTPKWQDEDIKELQTIKENLNEVKSKLNDYELSDWHRHTRSMNPADKVMRRLRKEMNVEFVTQAWCKFYEIVSKFKLIPQDAVRDKTFYSFHFCEAPGAFVASLNHYIKLNHPELDWYWRANSLNPYYEGNHLSEMINDDRFMLQTIKYWDFGPDNTGDITHSLYPMYLRTECGDKGAHLITADGSFDCQDKPEEQENSVSWLHLKETLNALSILRKDGNFVIKMFTFFECDTICLLLLLAVAFLDVNVIKPATSKEGNSEVYVVCQKYRGRDHIQPYLNALTRIDAATYEKYAMFPFAHYSKLYLRTLVRCANKFADQQISIIERNIRLYEERHDVQLRKHCEFLQDKFFEYYVQRYKLRPLEPEDNIVTVQKLRAMMERKTSNIIESRDYNRGSHADKLRRSTLTSNDLLEKITEELSGRLCVNLNRNLIIRQSFKCLYDDFDLCFGKPIDVVYSSQFCHGQLMRLRNELIKIYGIRKYNIAATDLRRRNEDPRYYCDFSQTYMQADNNEAQADSCKLLYTKITHLRNGDSFRIYEYPLLTQFNVNMMCVLNQCFGEIEFIHPRTLELRDFDCHMMKKWQPKLQTIWMNYRNCKSVISFLPVSCVTGPDNPLYKWVVNVNNARVYYEINRIIDFKPLTSDQSLVLY